MFFKYLLMSQNLAIIFIWKVTSRPSIWLPYESYFIYLKCRYDMFNIFLIFWNFVSSKVFLQPLDRIHVSNAFFFVVWWKWFSWKKFEAFCHFGPFWPIFPFFFNFLFFFFKYLIMLKILAIYHIIFLFSKYLTTITRRWNVHDQPHPRYVRFDFYNDITLKMQDF